ncbi:MAG: hypothetical protein PHR79_09405 [Bacteroidales bacterium]|nr:hypothetical protein [Bacteroidales bacterium]
MKKSTLLFVAFTFFFLSACNQKGNQKEELISFSTAEEYNNYIVDLQLETIKSIMMFSDACAEGVPQQMEFTYQDFQSQAVLSFEKIKKLGDFNGSTELRDAAIDLFGFYVEISQNEYKQILDILLKREYSEQDDIIVDSLITIVGEKEETHDSAFENAQEKFALDNELQMVKSN